jgi:hypothetical protein
MVACWGRGRLEMMAAVILSLMNTRPGYAANQQLLRRNLIPHEKYVYT